LEFMVVIELVAAGGRFAALARGQFLEGPTGAIAAPRERTPLATGG
jgi:hypothetical protein